MKTTDSVIVSYDNTSGEDFSVLIVGKQKRKFLNGKVVQHMEIINAFQGREANDIWNRLTVVNKEGRSNESSEKM